MVNETQKPPAFSLPASEEDAVVSRATRRAHVVYLTGASIGRSHELESTESLIGRSNEAVIQIEEAGVSRDHARIVRLDDGTYAVEDAGSKNGTLVNGRPITGRAPLNDGDKIQLGPTAVLKFALLDDLDRMYQNVVERAISRHDWQASEAQTKTFAVPRPWSPDSWRSRRVQQAIVYADQEHLNRAVTKLSKLPPLVTSWEIEELKSLLAEAEEGQRFLLQGGDCAETLADCSPDIVTNKLKILLQMSLVLTRGVGRPIIRVGRFAGQYAKPRSKMTEVRDGVELPSYLGDLVNRPEFTPEARRPDPDLLVDGYQHAATTLNFIRSLSSGGFADLRQKEYFDLSYFERADLPPNLRVDYNRIAREITDGLSFMRAVGDRSFDELMRVKFYTSHEALNLNYEAAQTRRVPRRDGHYVLTTHLPWIGDRTRALDGAHVEFFRGIENPVGIKIGPSSSPDEIVELMRVLNPRNEAGKLVLITRFGAKQVGEKLPPLIERIREEYLRGLWVCDPMHGNGMLTPGGTKTRNFDDILEELERSIEIHARMGTVFGGVHFELTGEDVTECIGGGLSVADLTRNYATLCDPRLNYRQAIQMAFCVAETFKATAKARPPTVPPPAPAVSGPPMRGGPRQGGKT